MTKPPILAAVDLVHKESDTHVIEEAILLARTHGHDVEVVFVVPDQANSYAQEYIPADMRQQVMDDAERDLKSYAEGFDWQGVPFGTKVLRGVVYENLINRADKLAASFVVIGASKPSVKDLLIGPNAARVSRNASCSVLVVRPR
ncbi:universal stress protein [Aliiroseovarius sp. 2305UL8-7]|uniref:universal stress protein n=1 Tax=Aliiroseovarius conchicola TaxID=3121637 RepID=UPI0035290549